MAAVRQTVPFRSPIAAHRSTGNRATWIGAAMLMTDLYSLVVAFDVHWAV